mmetsp:Transcript_35380/g.83864  ORF Transcript_35380/g.83864 Transcript_35380/m.83864 type:complete len:315 (+) Transcript_35380:323-1267(+)
MISFVRARCCASTAFAWSFRRPSFEFSTSLLSMTRPPMWEPEPSRIGGGPSTSRGGKWSTGCELLGSGWLTMPLAGKSWNESPGRIVSPNDSPLLRVLLRLCAMEPPRRCRPCLRCSCAWLGLMVRRSTWRSTGSSAVTCGWKWIGASLEERLGEMGGMAPPGSVAFSTAEPASPLRWRGERVAPCVAGLQSGCLDLPLRLGVRPSSSWCQRNLVSFSSHRPRDRGRPSPQPPRPCGLVGAASEPPPMLPARESGRQAGAWLTSGSLLGGGGLPFAGEPPCSLGAAAGVPCVGDRDFPFRCHVPFGRKTPSLLA